MKEKSMNNITAATTQRKNTLNLLLFIILLSFVIVASNSRVEAESELVKIGDYEYPSLSLFENDPIMRLLGRDFIEITQLLGVPDEMGYGEEFGPNQYILYKYEKGFMRFSVTESLENKVVNSVILGPGQIVIGATVGMHFQEIIDIVGTPDFGPEIGMDDLYYMIYYYGEIHDQMPEIFVSFVSVSIDSPTDYVFIKLEHSKLDGILLQAGSVAER